MKYLVLKEQKRNLKPLKETDDLTKAVSFMIQKRGRDNLFIAKVIGEWEITEK